MPNHIKICYTLPEYNEETSSHFYHHYEFLEELSKRADVFLIAEKGKKEGRAGINIIYTQKFHFLPFRFLENFWLILKARMIGYKIFYTHVSYISGINAAIVSRLTGAKSYYWNCAMNWLFKQRFFQGIGYKLCLKLSHYLVTGSEGMKKGYSEHYNLSPAKIKVKPNWINLDRFKPRPKAQNPKLKTLLFVHWLSKRKGADKIVPIIKSLSKLQTINFKLIVVGDGPDKNKLITEIKKNNFENVIEVVGAVPNKEIVNYYDKADIFIMPSMEEGFPRVLLEAMAMGIPYVAFDVGAVREISPKIVQDFIVERVNIEEFAEKIKILLADQVIYNQFREEELKKVQNYSLEKATDNFINLFL